MLFNIKNETLLRRNAGGKPSTWLPPGGLVERLKNTTRKCTTQKAEIIASNKKAEEKIQQTNNITMCDLRKLFTKYTQRIIQSTATNTQ